MNKEKRLFLPESLPVAVLLMCASTFTSKENTHDLLDFVNLG